MQYLSALSASFLCNTVIFVVCLVRWPKFLTCVCVCVFEHIQFLSILHPPQESSTFPFNDWVASQAVCGERLWRTTQPSRFTE